MSKQQKRIFRLTMILPFLLLICVVLCLQKSSESAAKYESEQDIIKKYEKSYTMFLNDKVFPYLNDVFSGADYDKKNDLIGERTAFYTHEGERLSGVVQIRNYFRGLRKIDITELKFSIKHVEVIMFEEPVHEDKYVFDAIAFGIWTYELKKEIDGKMITVDDPGGETDSRHHSSCEWEPEEPGGDTR